MVIIIMKKAKMDEIESSVKVDHPFQFIKFDI